MKQQQSALSPRLRALVMAAIALAAFLMTAGPATAAVPPGGPDTDRRATAYIKNSTDVDWTLDYSRIYHGQWVRGNFPPATIKPKQEAQISVKNDGEASFNVKYVYRNLGWEVKVWCMAHADNHWFKHAWAGPQYDLIKNADNGVETNDYEVRFEIVKQ